jgi:type I restriction enzyme S subunit
MIAAKNAKVAKVDWKTVKLGEVGRIVGGATPSTKVSENYGGDISWITPKDLANYSGRYITHGERNITQVGFDSTSTVMLPKGSILFSSRAPIGYVAIAGCELCTNQGFKSIVPNNKLDSEFCYYLLKSEAKNIERLGSGTTFKEVSGSTMRDVVVTIPPLPTQRKIAAVLGALDDKIENNRKICANLEAQAQALFKSWFVDFEPLGGKMPKDWREFKLSDIAEFYGGYSYKGSELQESSCAMATIKNYERGGGFKLAGFKEIVPSEKLKTSHEVDLFDTIVAHTDLTQKAEVIGNAEMLLSKAGYEKIIMSMDLVKVLPKSGISKFLLGALLKNPIFKSHCLRYVNGTTVLHLSKMALQEYALYLPSKIDDLKNVEKLFEGVARKQAFAVNESRVLAELRDALLPKLMSGELDVDDVEV